MSTTTALLIPTLAQASDLAPATRLWIYTTARPLTTAESALAQRELDAFAHQWTAHNQALKARAEVFAHQFILLAVDETQAGASGCSIDKSVHFLEKIGAHLGVDFFDRMLFGWVNAAGEIEVANRADFAARVQAGDITDETLVVNTLAQTLGELREKWLLPFGGSWQQRLVR